ncbi:MAG: hypothetical protein MMC33_001694 [Icmadophila ericetorum]|nr:hypothetical protein [Icmadophila ericetorum]
MLSLRMAAWALPRTASRIVIPFFRQPIPLLRQSLTVTQPWTLRAKPSLAAFSTSQFLREKEGEVDQELSAKIESELQMEKEMRDTEELPPNIKEFLEDETWELKDVAGEEEVTMSRTFGDEKITLAFSIADLNQMEEDPDRYSDDKALYDEDEMPSDSQSGGAQSKNTINQGRTQGGSFNVAPEDSVSPADRAELVDDESPAVDGEEEPSFPARLNVTIEKPGVEGKLQLEATAQDGMIVIEHVNYLPRGKDDDLMERYTGPHFGNLDQDLQVLLERYLDERGVNTALALWIPDYIDFKEQREYLNWLSNVKSFVDA